MAENLPFASASEAIAPVRESGFIRAREARDDGADGNNDNNNKASAVVQVCVRSLLVLLSAVL